jgi:hypothetical protein
MIRLIALEHYYVKARFYGYPGYRPDEGQGTNPRGGMYERRDGTRVGVRLSGNPDHRHPGP